MKTMSGAPELPDLLGGRSVPRQICVAIADPRALIAVALEQVLGLQEDLVITARGATDLAVLAEFAAHPPDVVVVGSGTHAAEAVTFALAVRRLMPIVAIVLLADDLERALVQFVLADRFSGLLLTDASTAEIASCLQQVIRGRTILPSGWQDVCTGGGPSPVAALSERQVEVLELLADGLSYAAIAQQLFISVNTVKFHVKAIFLALGVTNRTAASRFLMSPASLTTLLGGVTPPDRVDSRPHKLALPTVQGPLYGTSQ